jgi:hypothetical protein
MNISYIASTTLDSNIHLKLSIKTASSFPPAMTTLKSSRKENIILRINSSQTFPTIKDDAYVEDLFPEPPKKNV